MTQSIAQDPEYEVYICGIHTLVGFLKKLTKEYGLILSITGSNFDGFKIKYKCRRQIY